MSLPGLRGTTHEWRERVADYHSGDVSAEERAAVEAHLAACAECRAALAAYDRFYALARSPLGLDAAAVAAADAAADGEVAMAPVRPLNHVPLPYRRLPSFAASVATLTNAQSHPAVHPAVRVAGAVLAASLILAGFAALFLPRLLGGPAQYSPYSPSFGGIAMISADEGWAAGRGQLWHYTDGRWGNVPYPFVDSGGGSQVFGMPGEGIDLQMLAPNNIWSAYGRAIYHFDGRQWSITYTLPSGDQTLLRAISFSSPDDGWAVGATLNTWHPALLHFSHGTWTHVAFESDSAIELWHVTAVSPDDAWASGESVTSSSVPGGAVLLHYAQGQWQREALPAGLTGIGTITMSGPNDVWMTAFRGDGRPATMSGVLLRYQNGAWRVARELGAGNVLWQIALTSPADGWGVGSGLWRYHDGAWSSVPLPSDATGAQLAAVGLVSADEGWASGFGVLLHLHDGTWTRYGQPLPTLPAGTPTPAPPCAAPATASSTAIQSGGLGASFQTFIDRWGDEHPDGNGDVYLGAYADSGQAKVYVDAGSTYTTGVASAVYLVDRSQHLSLDQARAIAANMLPRDATLYPQGNALLPQPDGTAEMYCSPAFAHAQQTKRAAAGRSGFPEGMLSVTYVQRADGGIDRIVFDS